jgi:hypothetical protein
MTSEGLGEVFKGDSADTCGGKFPLLSMGGRVNGQACEVTVREDPHRRERKFLQSSLIFTSDNSIPHYYSLTSKHSSVIRRRKHFFFKVYT